MRVTHPDGNTDLFMVDGTQFMAELDVNGPGLVTIGYLGSDRGLLIDHDEWGAFATLVGEINEHVLERAADGAPHVDDAYYMGAKGGEATESERLAFESWMHGHCWALCATWDGKAYRSDAEQGGYIDPRAVRTRQLWAAWRDRAALASLKPPNDEVI